MQKILNILEKGNIFVASSSPLLKTVTVISLLLLGSEKKL
jgi:hypothetical protein